MSLGGFFVPLILQVRTPNLSPGPTGVLLQWFHGAQQARGSMNVSLNVNFASWHVILESYKPSLSLYFIIHKIGGGGGFFIPPKIVLKIKRSNMKKVLNEVFKKDEAPPLFCSPITVQHNLILLVNACRCLPLNHPTGL